VDQDGQVVPEGWKCAETPGISLRVKKGELNKYEENCKMDVLTPEQRHKNMSHIKNKNSKIECVLRKALWDKGFRYRKNCAELPGKPDIVLTKHHIAIFCDSEFFHGKDFENLESQLKRSANSDFWIDKIKRNMARDVEVDIMLQNMNWTVVRFWGKDIIKNTDNCVRVIESMILEKSRSR
jgi:DNA mismatch endonuclease (patch repair protein)